ncbi:MAG: Hpt domain-containing protein [Treponema sp.]|nr:Hpt domain-containing protein [Candidatus Treponema merdequi]
MTVRECYEAINSDYNEVFERLGKEERIAKFSKMFFTTGDIDSLKDAVEKNDPNLTFEISHTMKGNCLNIGFNVLTKKISDLVEYVRGREIKDPAEAKRLFDEIKVEYEKNKNIFSQLS